MITGCFLAYFVVYCFLYQFVSSYIYYIYIVGHSCVDVCIRVKCLHFFIFITKVHQIAPEEEQVSKHVKQDTICIRSIDMPPLLLGALRTIVCSV